AAGYELVIDGRREEDGLRLGHHLAVHAGELELVVEVGHRSHAAHHHVRPDLLQEVHHEARDPGHLDARTVGEGLAGERDTFVDVEDGRLAAAVGDTHHHRVEQAAREIGRAHV